MLYVYRRDFNQNISHPAIMTLDLNTQSAVVHAIESIMDEEEKQNADESVSDFTDK